MSSTPGVDLLRGRPTPAIGTTEAKLQQRKLDALRRGIHRVANAGSLPYGVHVVGVGGAGVASIATLLAQASTDLLSVGGSRFTALAVDTGADELARVRDLASRLRSDRAQVETIQLHAPATGLLYDTLARYRDFLKLEYPLYHWNPHYRPWLEPDALVPGADGHTPRAVAKALYGRAYYDGDRPMAAALRRFAASVEATRGDAVVCLVFGLGGGTGSGIALDLARHLSNGIFGRRVLVMGIGIAPCDGDREAHRGAALFPVMNELDCLCDENKNKGIVISCGELYKNPFTAGFLLVPQQAAWHASRDLAATHERVDGELVSLLTARSGANLWEVLRLLNWVAAPSTQHSAARTPWGSKWIHVFGFCDSAAGSFAMGPQLPGELGLRPCYRPEFVELRVADATDPGVAAIADGIARTFAPEVAPVPAGGGRTGSVQFTLPRAAKTDLTWFVGARSAYDAAGMQERMQDHALLLEQGVLLCEPSTRIAGMAGAGIGGSQQWIAVPLTELRGEDEAGVGDQ